MSKCCNHACFSLGIDAVGIKVTQRFGGLETVRVFLSPQPSLQCERWSHLELVSGQVTVWTPNVKGRVVMLPSKVSIHSKVSTEI